MPRGRRRKIEVPTDTQPQFELGDTAADIKRRREREERDERERIDPPYGSNWGHEIANFVFFPYIYFILAFRDLQCIKMYWETLCDEFR